MSKSWHIHGKKSPISLNQQSPSQVRLLLLWVDLLLHHSSIFQVVVLGSGEDGQAHHRHVHPFETPTEDPEHLIVLEDAHPELRHFFIGSSDGMGKMLLRRCRRYVR